MPRNARRIATPSSESLRIFAIFRLRQPLPPRQGLPPPQTPTVAARQPSIGDLEGARDSLVPATFYNMVGSAHSTPYRRSMSCSRSWTGSAPRPGGAAGPALACAGSWFRPSAVGSLRVWPNDPAGHTDALSARLHVFAQAGWLALADVYTEHTDVPAFREGRRFARSLTSLVTTLSTSGGFAACTGPGARPLPPRPARTC